MSDGTRYTPGPWRVQVRLCDTQSGGFSVWADADRLIAMIYWDDDESAESIATAERDAHLIAASPALREALEKLIEQAERRHAGQVVVRQLERKAIRKATEALVAARGEDGIAARVPGDGPPSVDPRREIDEKLWKSNAVGRGMVLALRQHERDIKALAAARGEGGAE